MERPAGLGMVMTICHHEPGSQAQSETPEMWPCFLSLWSPIIPDLVWYLEFLRLPLDLGICLVRKLCLVPQLTSRTHLSVLSLLVLSTFYRWGTKKLGDWFTELVVKPGFELMTVFIVSVLNPTLIFGIILGKRRKKEHLKDWKFIPKTSNCLQTLFRVWDWPEIVELDKDF